MPLLSVDSPRRKFPRPASRRIRNLGPRLPEPAARGRRRAGLLAVGGVDGRGEHGLYSHLEGPAVDFKSWPQDGATTVRKTQSRESELLTSPLGSRKNLCKDATPIRRLPHKGVFSPGKPADLKFRGTTPRAGNARPRRRPREAGRSLREGGRARPQGGPHFPRFCAFLDIRTPTFIFRTAIRGAAA